MALEVSVLITILIIAILLVITILALMHIFLFTDAGSLTSTILLLLLITLGFVFKHFHLPFSSNITTVGLTLLFLGIYIYGIRCLFLAGKNSYLKYLVFLGSCFISIALAGLMFKLQHWPGGYVLVTIANYSMVIGTIVVLLTLPSSGYIEWHDLHKKIFKRILVPWMFIFALFIMSFLIPKTFKAIMAPENKRSISFEMHDYIIENKNGLKAE